MFDFGLMAKNFVGFLVILFFRKMGFFNVFSKGNFLVFFVRRFYSELAFVGNQLDVGFSKLIAFVCNQSNSGFAKVFMPIIFGKNLAFRGYYVVN